VYLLSEPIVPKAVSLTDSTRDFSDAKVAEAKTFRDLRLSGSIPSSEMCQDSDT
jgi:hypothetical protein